MGMENHMNIDAVTNILEKENLSNWARRYWTKVQSQLLLTNSGDELVTRSAGLPHLWSTTGQQPDLINKLLGK
jgi:hypothetical protein